MSRWYDYPYFKPSIPREAKGGIKAQSRRGMFGESWWARRWISVLESFNIGARLGRGRSYARRGQVLSIEIEKGKISAKVQGSRPKPYNIHLEVKTLSAGDWKKLTKALSQEAIFVAKLLSGEMPSDIEKVFKGAGLSLFPERLRDLKTSCSCPDWSNPCKHIAAVYYLLGEEFDRDPFLIFKLRGMSREELMEILGRAKRPRSRSTLSPRPETSASRSTRRLSTGSVESLRAKGEPSPSDQGVEGSTLDISKFWNGESLPADFFGEISIPLVSAALPKRLGSFPFWRGKVKFLDAMEPIYKQASSIGLNIFVGEQINAEKSS